MIQLVPAHVDYALLWYKWRSEKQARRDNPLGDASIDDLKKRIARSSSKFEDAFSCEEILLFASHGKEIVGSIALKNASSTMLYGEIGYHVGESFSGKGFATEIVRQFANLVFAKTPIRKLYAYVAETNIASAKVLAKVGFAQEGLLRQHYLILGKPVNQQFFGLLRGEVLKQTII